MPKAQARKTCYDIKLETKCEKRNAVIDRSSYLYQTITKPSKTSNIVKGRNYDTIITQTCSYKMRKD